MLIIPIKDRPCLNCNVKGCKNQGNKNIIQCTIKVEQLDCELYDMAGRPIAVTVSKPNNLIPMSQLFEYMCKRLSDD